MGRRGNPYDNAKAEYYMDTLQVEAVYPMAYETFDIMTNGCILKAVVGTRQRSIIGILPEAPCSNR